MPLCNEMVALGRAKGLDGKDTLRWSTSKGMAARYPATARHLAFRPFAFYSLMPQRASTVRCIAMTTDNWIATSYHVTKLQELE